MAKYLGNVAKVSIGGTLVTQNDITSMELSYDLTNVNTEGMGDAWQTALRQIKNATFTVNGYSDDSGTATANSLRAVAKACIDDSDGIFAIIFYPAGNASGKQTVTFNALLTSYTVPTDMTAAAAITLAFQQTGGITEGTA